ncbi:hypothetical protein P9112_001762 [Eukaryota sp. TZLM1-RC]
MEPPPCLPYSIYIAGGGGKTSLMYTLAHFYAQLNLRVVVTTTTKLAPEVPSHIVPSTIVSSDTNYIRSKISSASSPSLVVSSTVTHNTTTRLVGFPPAVVQSFTQFCDVLIVEADGSRQLPLKCPAEHEPQIDANANTVYYVVGADCLGEVVNDVVFRSELIPNITQFNNIVTPCLVADLIKSDKGGLKMVPDDADFNVVINKKELKPVECRILAKLLVKTPRIDNVFLTSLKDLINCSMEKINKNEL